MTRTAVVEVSEGDASGAVADAYEVIRTALRSNFVPTIYRRLAVHPDAFEIAVSALPDVVRIGDDTSFVNMACSAARAVLPVPVGPDVVALQALSHDQTGPASVLDRYRRANPLNLLFSMSICGINVPPQPAVMRPPLPTTAGSGLWADIEACHHAAFVPGVWRELEPWPNVLTDLWSRTRALANADGIASARDAVRQLAISVLTGTSIEHRADRVRVALGPSAVAFDWFPTGVATMIAEVEWLTWYSGTPHQGKDRP